jgi:hypothetical protein
MKKRHKKLALHRDTVQLLTPGSLEAVGGASVGLVCAGPSYQSPCYTGEHAPSFCDIC